MFEPRVPRVNGPSSYPQANHSGKDSIHPLTEIAQQTFQPLKEFPPAHPTERQMVAQLHPDMQIQMTQKFMSDAAVKILVTAYPSLTSVNLAGHLFITNATLEALANLPQLQKLNLALTQVTSLTPLIEHRLPNLKDVNFYSLRIESENLIAFLQNYDQLTHLTLPETTPKGIFKTIPLHHLKQVTLHVGRSMTIEDLIFLIKNAPELTSIRVRLCSPLTESELEQFAECLPKLSEVDLIGDERAVKPHLKEKWQKSLFQVNQGKTKIVGGLYDWLKE
ncbi:MAG: hypothetical protein LLG04_07855 [Parachlamydia sp.]|nr:hypothetical protein [Parachlamydia sp.]